MFRVEFKILPLEIIAAETFPFTALPKLTVAVLAEFVAVKITTLAEIVDPLTPALVNDVAAFVPTLKLFNAELVKLNVVTPLFIDALAKATLAVALSLTYTLPFNAWEVNVVALVLKAVGVPLTTPMFPFNESRANVGVVTVPVKLELLISLYEIKATAVVPLTFPARLKPPALDSRITLLPATLLLNAVVKLVVAELVAITE